MSDPPIDRSDFWIRFVCAMLCFGIFNGVVILALLSMLGTKYQLLVWLVTTILASRYMALHGDDAWGSMFRWFGRIIEVLCWWR